MKHLLKIVSNNKDYGNSFPKNYSYHGNSIIKIGTTLSIGKFRLTRQSRFLAHKINGLQFMMSLQMWSEYSGIPVATMNQRLASDKTMDEVFGYKKIKGSRYGNNPRQD